VVGDGDYSVTYLLTNSFVSRFLLAKREEWAVGRRL
jgi:hypothetical protein